MHNDKVTISTFELLVVNKPKSQQALAEELHMDMRDTFTRMFVAAMYWREVADYYRALLRDVAILES